VLLATAPASDYPGYLPRVRARWTAPDGARHTGAVPALPGQRAGSTVLVWADAAGRVEAKSMIAQAIRLTRAVDGVVDVVEQLGYAHDDVHVPPRR
jgi:hypothetical protein